MVTFFYGLNKKNRSNSERKSYDNQRVSFVFKRPLILVLVFFVAFSGMLLPLVPSVRADFYTSHKFSSVSFNISMNLYYLLNYTDKGSVKRLNVNYYLVPQSNLFQSLNSIEPFPKQNAFFVRGNGDVSSENASNYIKYIFNNPDKGKKELGYSAEVTTFFKPITINKKISYPFSFNNDSLKPYLEPTEKIDSNNPQIVALAKQLRANASDYFGVVFNTAKWVKEHVHYDLNSLTAKATEKASWVLNSKYGVCDEITVLFIALLRANGIPAKFISGIAYTNSPIFENNWGFHGWAEVYFPYFGWLPFDVTFGEYGEVDPLRIILIESNKAVSPAVTYSAQHYEQSSLSVSVSDSHPNVHINNYELRNNDNDIVFNDTLFSEKIDFGSYNLFRVVISNPSPYYKIVHLRVLSASNVYLDNKSYLFYLSPGGHAVYTSLVHPEIKNNFNYMYSSPIIVEINGKSVGKELLKISKGYKHYQKSFFDSYDSELGLKVYNSESNEIKPKGVPFDMKCSYDTELLQGDNLSVSCNLSLLKNSSLTDVSSLKNLKVCFDGDCRFYNFIKESNIKLSKIVTNDGFQSSSLSIPHYNYVKVFRYSVIKKPKVSIGSLNYPKKVTFNNDYNVVFNLSFENQKILKKCEVHVFINNRDLFNQNVSDFSKIYNVNVPFNSYFLDSGDNS
ncbi:MAG: hypothetical protein GWP09_01690, partial [Nitrospiraceae bacterium]|nr:hypothetical protein [Nitrospiraceae bacterium]